MAKKSVKEINEAKDFIIKEALRRALDPEKVEIVFNSIIETRNLSGKEAIALAQLIKNQLELDFGGSS